MLKEIIAKTLLSPNKYPQEWFDIAWNYNVYRGCPHACIYCDSRADCYQIGDFDTLSVKTNAAELLAIELSKKRKIRTIGTGSMSDPYNPYELDLNITKATLEIIQKHGFPVHINTKSDLVTRDIDLLSDIHKESFCSVAFSFTCTDDQLARKLEPGASLPSQRLRAMKILSEAGIYCGALFTPFLPGITDSKDNVENTLKALAEHHAKYAFTWFSLSLKNGSREYYFDALKQEFPSEAPSIIGTYRNSYECVSPKIRELAPLYKRCCEELGIKYRMQDIQTWERCKAVAQLNIFDNV